MESSNGIKNQIWNDIDLDYAGKNNFASFFSTNNNIHSYPAKAVPEMVKELLETMQKQFDIQSVLDPFLGSGTVGLEAKYLNIDFYGSDLNPLSILLSRTKMLTVQNISYLKAKLIKFIDQAIIRYENNKGEVGVTFKNIDYWFKKETIKELSYIKSEIACFIESQTKKYREAVALTLLTAFSSTIRACSLTRNGEFKLYRMSLTNIKKFNVNSLKVFREKVVGLIEMLAIANKAYEKNTISEIYLENAKNLSYMDDKKVNLVLTSPPYGDSQSTVAYGQFSRLSLQWMGDLLDKYLNINVYTENCDDHLLGGRKSEANSSLEFVVSKSPTLVNLRIEMKKLIDEEAEVWRKAKIEILKFIKELNRDNSFYYEEIIKNEMLNKLIKERIRLDILRRINNRGRFSNTEAKNIAKREMKKFINDLLSNDLKKKYRRHLVLQYKLPAVHETINRKLISQPKRIQEILDFFRDLYEVVEETNRILCDDGLQAWIVGHRTVLGKININMRDILKDWFEDMGYIEVKSLKRNYSFKRLPQHINSTSTRNEKITTMLQEHILIVQKNTYLQSK